MRRTKSGFGMKDLDTLYQSFGFVFREGRDRFYFHPRHKHLCAIVARHTELAKGYISHAVHVIDELKRLEEEDAATNSK